MIEVFSSALGFQLSPPPLFFLKDNFFLIHFICLFILDISNVFQCRVKCSLGLKWLFESVLLPYCGILLGNVYRDNFCGNLS